MKKSTPASPSPVQPALPASIGNAISGPLSSRFLVIVLAFQRARQLQGGARPRVDPTDHKQTRVALLEVMADTISWTNVVPVAPVVPTAA